MKVRNVVRHYDNYFTGVQAQSAIVMSFELHYDKSSFDVFAKAMDNAGIDYLTGLASSRKWMDVTVILPTKQVVDTFSTIAKTYLQ